MDDLGAGLDRTARAIEIYPSHWEAQYLRGLLLHRSGRPDEAVGFLERAVELHSMYGPAYAALGNALMTLQRPTPALDAYRSAVILEPANAAHYLNLATAYGALGQAELEARALATHRRLRVEQ